MIDAAQRQHAEDGPVALHLPPKRETHYEAPYFMDYVKEWFLSNPHFGETPQERYDLFMNNYTERTWTLVTFNAAIRDLMKTYIQYPPRKLQSEVYTGPITISEFQRFQFIREQLQKEGVHIPLPTGN